MFNQNLVVDLSVPQNLPEVSVVYHTENLDPVEQNASGFLKFLKEIPEKAKESPEIVHENFGPDLIKAGITYGRSAPMGQIPKLVGKDLGILGKDYPETTKRGVEDLLKSVRGGDVWEDTDNDAAQRVRFDTLDIILAALNEVSVHDKMPDWVNPELARTVTEMIVLPYFFDHPMKKALAVRMEGPYGLLPSEVAERHSSKACETLEVLLVLSPHLADEAKKTADNLEGLIECEALRNDEAHSIAVCALGCAHSAIARASVLSPAAARNRLRENVRQVSYVTLIL